MTLYTQTAAYLRTRVCSVGLIVGLVTAAFAPTHVLAQRRERCTDLLPMDHVRNPERAASILKDLRRRHIRERRLMIAALTLRAVGAAFFIPAANRRFPEEGEAQSLTRAQRVFGIAGLVFFVGGLGTSYAGTVTGLRFDRCIRRAHFVTPDDPVLGRRPHSRLVYLALVPGVDIIGSILVHHVVRRARLLRDIELRFAPPFRPLQP